jgi:hypothetical protein
VEYQSGNVLIRNNRLEKAGEVFHGHHYNFVTKGAIEAMLPDGTSTV